MAGPNAPHVTVRSRAELREWLAANHATSGAVWLVSYKRPHPDFLPYDALVEELLCWGWIDSLPKAIDAEASANLIAPRKEGSAWSALNKARVLKLRAEGKMAPAGEAKIATAHANGMWDFLDDVERLEVPNDLAAALDASSGRAFWDAQPRSIRRAALEWLKTAKGSDTRAARLSEIAGSAGQGLRPKPFRR